MLKILFILIALPLISIFIKTITLWTFSIIIILLLAIYLLIIIIPILSFTPIYSSFIFIDSLSMPLIILTLWTSALILMASIPVAQASQSPKFFNINIIILAIFLYLTFSSNNFLVFYIFFEASLIPTLLLILGWGYQPERLQAGLYLIIYTVTASLPLLISILIIYKKNHTIFILINITLPTSYHFILLWWLASIIAFIVKIPLFITHLWLPKAHVEAPVAGSIILAGILLKLGRYGLIRLATPFWWISSKSYLAPIFARISIWGAIITAIICLRQPDLKALIAYSSVGHIGLIIAGFISRSTWGWEASLTIIIAHGLCSSALFAIANITYESTKSRSILLNKGLLAIFPSIAIWWFILTAANIGAPPSINLLSEISLITSILTLSHSLYIILIISIFFRGTYSLIIYTSTQHGNPPIYINILKIYSSRNHIILLIHVVPLFILILKVDLSISWIL